MTDEAKRAMTVLRAQGWDDTRIAKAFGVFTSADVKDALGAKPRPKGETASLPKVNAELRRNTDPNKRRVGL